MSKLWFPSCVGQETSTPAFLTRLKRGNPDRSIGEGEGTSELPETRFCAIRPSRHNTVLWAGVKTLEILKKNGPLGAGPSPALDLSIYGHDQLPENL